MQKHHQYSFITYLSLAIIIVLTIMTIAFYKERIFFVDPIWIVFNIVNNHSFAIAEYRYGALITQAFPWIGSHLNLSLKSIAILYSASFYIFYLSTALLIIFYFKQRIFAVLLAIYLTLFVSDVYYWPNNEVHQGIAWILLFLSAYFHNEDSNNKYKHWNFWLLPFLAFMAISSHLLVALPLLFIWSFKHLEKGIKKSFSYTPFIIFTLLLLVFIFIRYKVSSSGWYDGKKLESVKSIDFNSILNSFQSGQSQSFLKQLLDNYWIAIVLFAFSTLLLFYQRRYLKLVLFIGFILAYYVLINITFPDAWDRSLQFYMESEWAALSIIIAYPLLSFLWKYEHKNLTLLANVFFILLFSVRMFYITQSKSLFRERVSKIENIIAKLAEEGHSKVLFIESEEFVEEHFLMDWGLPIESMALSQIMGIEPLVSFKIIKESPEESIPKTSFYSSFSIEENKTLNARYFHLDEKQDYIILENQLEEYFLD